LSQKATVARFTTTTPNTVVVSEVYYSKGGTNIFSGRTDARGYWLSVGPQEEKDGMVLKTAGSGFRTFMEATSRVSASRLRALAEKARELPEFKDLLRSALHKNGLELSDPSILELLPAEQEEL
jgi:hypothetical protein